MGYQESIIHTNLKNVKKNNEEIERILKLFQKYDCRCHDDLFASCTHKLHFTEDMGKYKAGMDVLVICGERDSQRSGPNLFNVFSYSDWNKFEDKSDMFFVKQKIYLTPLENVMYIIKGEESGKILQTKLNLVAEKAVLKSNNEQECEADEMEYE